uniref:Serine/threonine-protein kinase 11-interacting protein n=2 Tax=Anthurium amnicola TaxID=1678845 RepID=A0A1D1XYS2_9ARAE
MAIVTGDRYLESLVRFVERNAEPLLEGTLTLKLNPVGLRYVQSRLEALEELEGLLAGAPVDYLRAYVSDLGDHRALEQLRRILRLLTSLKVISVIPPPERDPTPLSLLPFGRLKVLELRGCDLSSTAARGLLELRHTLEKLICHNSTDALRHVFASRIVDIKDSPTWNRLSFISCACNGLVLMDESLQLLPVVEILDLSRNQFAKVDNLRKCTRLRHLDLGFNHLRTVTSLSEVLCPIIKLVLRNNALTTLCGIENLKSVEGLDLSYNILSTFSELEILASLPSLQSVWLEGNPICCARWYRAHVFSFFSHPEKVKLDEKGINTREFWERHVVLASRHKRPAGYGFYFPANENANDDSSVNTKKKSRLALIEDEEQRRYFCAESVDQDSASCDSDNLKKAETVVTDSEAEITDLMNRVEFMKKEQSVLWLRNFREWMDQAAQDGLYVGKCMESNLSNDTGKYSKQRKGEKHLGKCPVRVMDSLQTSEGEYSINSLDSDKPFSDTSVCIHGRQLSYSNGKAALTLPFVDETGFQTGRVDPEYDQVGVCCKELLDSVPSENNSSFFLTNFMLEGGEETEGRKNSASLTAFEEIMESRLSSHNPGSPPHYQEDILHRRQNMEDDFLLLSAESYLAASSDSDTSCSDDDSSNFCNSSLGIDQLFNEESMKRSLSDHTSEFELKDDPQDARERDSIILMSGTNVEPYSSIREPTMSNHGEPFPTSAMDESSSERGRIISEDVGDKGKGKWKPKRRVATLLEENSLAANDNTRESNGILEVNKADIEDEYKLPSCNENHLDKLQDREEKWLVLNSDASNASLNSFQVQGDHLRAKPSSLDAVEVHMEKYFLTNLADSGGSETCQELICCDCILGEGPGYQEREVAVLRSNKQKVYVLLINLICEGPGVVSKVLGCHRLEEIKEVVIGLGLQTLRVQVEGDVSYMFLVRSSRKLERLLYLLRACDSGASSSGCSMKSWDQVQTELFDKHVCGGLKISIFLYSVLLFWHDKCEGDSWLSRSLFLVEGYVLLCFEDLLQFGKSTDDIGVSTPYFTLDSCCPIENILEMVIEPKETRCLTLILDHVTLGKNYINRSDQKPLAEKAVHVLTWRLKWFSEERLLKFVALLKAIHAGLATSPLHVKCKS